jgi:hypothetical protein
LKKFLIAAVLATLVASGAGLGVSQAKSDNGKAGPNGSNEHGLCTAYFNGQKKGNSDNAPPFVALAEAADTSDDEQPATTQEMYTYCTGVDKGIGGNPTQSGRFADCFDDNDCTNDSA